MGHKLNLTIDNTIACSTLRVSDSSIYQDNQPVQNLILEITPPNASCPVVFTPLKGFNLILNVSNLKILQVDNFENYNISDGVYKIKYSINPNSKLFIETVHFRTCKIDNMLNLEILNLFNESCKINKSDFEKKEMNLIKLKFQIQAAKSFAELENNFDKAYTLYNGVFNSLKNKDACSTC
jgi:hypothetical protein